MNVRRFEDVKAFYDQVEPFLMQDEAANNLILGLCASLKLENVYKEPAYLACCERDGQVIGVALRTPPYKLVLSPIGDDAAIRALVDDACASAGRLPGVTAIQPVGERAAAYWRQQTGQAAKIRLATRIYL